MLDDRPIFYGNPDVIFGGRAGMMEQMMVVAASFPKSAFKEKAGSQTKIVCKECGSGGTLKKIASGEYMCLHCIRESKDA